MSELTDVRTRNLISPQNVRDNDAQVENNAGGFVHKLDDFGAAQRFLVLGTAGGTYYATQKSHTDQAVETLRRCIKADGGRKLAGLAREISVEGRAPKNDQALFTLALILSEGDLEARRYVAEILPEVARTGTHLFHFAQYMEQFRGWGRVAKRALRNWYGGKTVDSLAYDSIKYRQRDGWSHRDIIRLAHPVTDEPARKAVFDFMCGREGDDNTPSFIRGFHAVNQPDSDVSALAVDFKLPWEALPNDRIDAGVLGTMVDNDLFPMGALVRQLPLLTRTDGVLTPARIDRIIDRLADAEAIRKSRLHPMAVLIAQTTYASGRSIKGKGTWSPKPAIIDALDEAFVKAFANVEPTNKRRLVAIDISGSMGWSPIANTALYPREAAAAMAMVTMRTERHADITVFSDGITPVNISGKTRLDDVVRQINGMRMGGTDCSLPMIWAAAQGKVYDSFEVYTDNETWAGRMKPDQALREYRKGSNPEAKLIVVGLTATNFTIADPSDPGMLDVVGFDAAAPKVMADFIAGRI